jgi:phosphomevalonate kinase
VETTIRYVLSYLGASIPDFAARELPGAAITIYADNDYYSQPPTPTTPPTATAAPLPRFNSLNVPLSSAHKTGLGSSAALTTALTACLLATYSPQPLAAAAAAAAAADTPMAPETESKIHNLAQAAHCAAQGKVGSGFDVAAAVFGSCVYRRFSPAVLEAVGDAGTAAFAARLRAAVDAAWDAAWGLAVLRTQLPPGLRLLMGDVDCGSSTPGMVRTLLAWRREQPHAAKALWDTLESLNRGLIALLADARAQAERSPQQYLEALKASSSGGGSSSSTSSTSSGSETLSESATLLRNISAQLASIRVNIRAMGEASGVPIEPPAQTALLDRAVAAVRGVLGGVVPGAGGYDAVVFLVTDTDDTVASLKRFLKNYRFEGTGGAVEALDTREEHKGVCWEDLSGYAL